MNNGRNMMARKKILTASQVGKLFNADDRVLRNLRSSKKLPYIRVDSGRILYYEHRIFEWLDKREVNVDTDIESNSHGTDTKRNIKDTE